MLMKSHKVNVFHFAGIIVKNPNFDFSHGRNNDRVAFLEFHNIAELESFKLVARFIQLPTKEVQAS